MPIEMPTQTPAAVRTDAIKSYLNDHQAGSMGGEELSANLADRLPQYRELAEIAESISQDRQTLQRLMDRFGADGSAVKQAGAMLMEKIGASVFAGASEANQALTHLKQIEVLRMGVYGKLCLWEALESIADADDRISGFNLERLRKAALSQLDGLSGVQKKIARKALVG